MGARELDAAGIHDPELRASYEACRRLNARHGRTYFLATRLLPADRRPAVHALYAFARWADEIVDDLGRSDAVEERARALAEWEQAFLAGERTGPVLPAVQDTVARYDITRAHFVDFLTAMRMDLDRDGYDTWQDLLGYVHGSGGVIGLQLLPVLGTTVPVDVAAPYAHELGVAFQLTNFIRDVGEDLLRGRVYLPGEDLLAFGVYRADLAAGVVDDRLRSLLAFEIGRTRQLLDSARLGIRLLAPESRDCVRVAWTLYGDILAAVERAGYRVLDRRVRVGLARRTAVALPGLLRARSALRWNSEATE